MENIKDGLTLTVGQFRHFTKDLSDDMPITINHTDKFISHSDRNNFEFAYNGTDAKIIKIDVVDCEDNNIQYECLSIDIFTQHTITDIK